MARTNTKLRVIGLAFQLIGHAKTAARAAINSELEPIFAEYRAEIDRIGVEYRDEVQRMESEWETEFGAPYPKDVEDWRRWAARVGWSGERIAEGNWSLRDLLPIIEG